MHIVPTILSGGSGTRLWPVSRKFDPKQLQPIVGDTSLLAQTAERLVSHANSVAPVVICNGAYADQVALDLTGLGGDAPTILEEPSGRDTAAAAAMAALFAREAHGDDSIVLLLPSDHYVKDVEALHTAVEAAAAAAARGYIATIGLKPTRPETGYGYIKREAAPISGLEAYPIDEFREKPDLETAKAYLASGDYLWNSGMFVYTPATFLKEMALHCPDILEASERAFAAAQTRISADGAKRVAFRDDLFGAIPKNSIDFAVMEHTRLGSVVAADMGWSDIGSWRSVHETLLADENGNVRDGDVYTTDVANSLILARGGRHVAVAGLSNVIIVDTPDAVLICDQDASQSVKAIHKHLDNQGADCAKLHGAESPAFQGYIRGWARDWFFAKALPFWTEQGMDVACGGSHEAVDFEGRPRIDMAKRVRVQCRQIYAFSRAREMGWTQGDNALQSVLDFLLTHYRHTSGGWITKVTRDGAPFDTSVESYDQAFVVLAMGWATKTTGDDRYRRIGEQTVDFLYNRMRHPAGGFLENLEGRTPRRANPHMHLLEAALHWIELFDDERMRELAQYIYALYRRHFCVNGLLREHFDEELRPLMRSAGNGDNKFWLEPGHLMEWAYLLRWYERIFNVEDDTIANLAGFAERYGVNRETGLLTSHCTLSGAIPPSAESRMWPQTEAVRFWLDRDAPGDRTNAYELLWRMKSQYLTLNGEEPGYFRDAIGLDGAHLGDHAPGSTLYHLFGAFETLF